MRGDAKVMRTCLRYLSEGASSEIRKASCLFIKKHPHLMDLEGLSLALDYLEENITNDSCVDALEAISTVREPYNSEARERVYNGMKLMQDSWVTKYALRTLHSLHNNSIPGRIIVDIATSRDYRVFSADTIAPYSENLECESATELLGERLRDGLSVHSDRVYIASMFAMMTPKTSGSAYQSIKDMFYDSECPDTRNEVLTGVSTRWSGPVSSRFFGLVKDVITGAFDDEQDNNIILALSLIPRMNKKTRSKLENDVLSIVKGRRPTGVWYSAVVTAIQMDIPIMYEALHEMTNTLSVSQRVELLELISKNK